VNAIRNASHGSLPSRAPGNTRRAPLLALVAFTALGAAACGGGPTAPGSTEPLTESVATADIVFFFATGDRVDADLQQGYHDWLEDALGVSLPGQMEYRKYRNRSHMGGMTGSQGNAWASPDPPVVHTIWPRDNHETVHVLAARFGRPTDFFNEGLAVAFQMDPVAGDLVAKWSGTPIHDIAARLRLQGSLPPLATWVESGAFRTRPDGDSYPTAGSFVRYLIDTHGLGAVRDLFGRAGNRDDSLAAVRAAFAAAFGISLEEAEAGWHAMLDGGAVSR
jgi:hypothetical protein